MKKAAVLCAVLCLLSGCAPHAREPEGLALVRVLGVDAGRTVTITAVCAGQNGAEGVRGSVTAEDLSSALKELPLSGERELALTNVSYIIINAEADFAEVLARILLDRDLNPSALVWAAEDAAGLLDACRDPEGRLRVLGEGEGAPPAAFSLLAALKAGEPVELPLLTAAGGTLRVCGMIRKEEAR